MTHKTSILTFCLGLMAFMTPQLGIAEEYVLTPEKGVSVSNGKWILELGPVIVTQEFDGEKTTSPSDVILVFPYKFTDLQGSDVHVSSQVMPRFYDQNGNYMRLPEVAYYSRSLKSRYFQTFGARSVLSAGLSFELRDDGGPHFKPPFPSIRLKIK